MISRSKLLAKEKETRDTGGEMIRFKGGGGRHVKAQISWGVIYPQLFLKGITTLHTGPEGRPTAGVPRPLAGCRPRGKKLKQHNP